MIDNFRTKKPLLFDITCSLIVAVLFSAFIYMEHYLTSVKLLNTLFGILALGGLLYISKRSVLMAGFAIGILWFYWVGYSFEYNSVGYLTPIVIFIFGIIYMLFFGTLALTNKVYIRALLLFGLSFFEPADWNWMQIELLFIDSYIGIYKYQLAIVLASLSLIKYLNKPYNYASLLLIILAFNFSTPEQKDASLKIKLVSTNITQDIKWKREIMPSTVSNLFNEIDLAVKENYDLILFPETVLPMFLNKSPHLLNQLSHVSKKITIVMGSLLQEDGNNYNVTYMFQNGDYQIAKKLVLVPFGEYIPLPKFMRKIINDTFFAGASDFLTADSPTDFIIKGIKFRNAICYEATCKEIYEGDVEFVLASSNNAWFAPSIEPTIQKLLMQYYARKNGTTIYHSANYKGTGIIK